MRVLAIGLYRKGPGSNSLLDAKLNVIRKEREAVGGRTRHSCSTFSFFVLYNSLDRFDKRLGVVC